jgi:3-oxoacyl-[acyl-carrier protein] reductase
MNIVLITGGASGLGKKLCIAFRDNNYKVLFTYNKTIPDSELEGCFGYKCNLFNEEEIKNTLRKIYDEHKDIDVLINNAAIENNKEFSEKTKTDFLKTLEINLVAPFLLSKEIGSRMYMKGYGKIINISSNNSIDKYDPVTVDYDASKAGLNILTMCLAKEFAPFVKVNAIAPGWILTDKMKRLDDSLDNKFVEEESKNILLNRFASCEDISNLVLFLASDKADYINSEIIKIDGGSYVR